MLMTYLLMAEWFDEQGQCYCENELEVILDIEQEDRKWSVMEADIRCEGVSIAKKLPISLVKKLYFVASKKLGRDPSVMAFPGVTRRELGMYAHS